MQSFFAENILHTAVINISALRNDSILYTLLNEYWGNNQRTFKFDNNSNNTSSHSQQNNYTNVD